MLAIIWAHIRGCISDLRAHHLADDLDVYTKPGGQVYVGDKHREWRLR